MSNFERMIDYMVKEYEKKGESFPHVRVIEDMLGFHGCMFCPLSKICNNGANMQKAEEFLLFGDNEVMAANAVNEEESDIFEYLRKFSEEVGSFTIKGEKGIEIEVRRG